MSRAILVRSHGARNLHRTRGAIEVDGKPSPWVATLCGKRAYYPVACDDPRRHRCAMCERANTPDGAPR